MSEFQRDFTVEWGDCDDAGIVFYPNFYYWFDSTYHALQRSKGLDARKIRERFNAVTPLVDTGCSFRSPVTYGDVITISARVAEWEERRLKLEYTVTCGDRLIAQGHEKRAWALVVGDGRLKGAAIPEEFRQLFSA